LCLSALLMVTARAPPGFIGLEILRSYIDKRRSNLTSLLGAFRGQCNYPQHRLAGLGTWSGPLNLESASARLTIGAFRAALVEVGISLPESETEAIFRVMAVDGTVSIAQLLRELRLDPCDRSGQWGRQGVGQNYLEPSSAPPSIQGVAPSLRSGYTQGPHMGLRVPFEVEPPPKPKEAFARRVAPTRSSGYSASVATGEALRHRGTMPREAPAAAPADAAALASEVATIFLTRPRSAALYPVGLLHSADPDGDEWKREGIGRSRPKSAAPTRSFPAPAENSGYTRSTGVDLRQPEAMAERAPEREWASSDERYPWTSGYSRGSRRTGVAPEAWAGTFEREGIGHATLPAPPPGPMRVAPTRHSGYHQTCQTCEMNKARGSGLCAFCRV